MADDWVAIAAFGKATRAWLAKFLAVLSGILSHDPCGRGFRALDPEQLQAWFRSWVQAVFAITTGQGIAVAGKHRRGSHDQPAGQAALQRVRSWASANQVVLGQLQVAEAATAIPASPALGERLDSQGGLVSVDAIGCQPARAQQIVAGGADDGLAVKENQGPRVAERNDLFASAHAIGFEPVVSDFQETDTKDPGRCEKRRGWTIAAPDFLCFLRDRE